MTNSLSGLRSFFRPWARDLVDVASRAGVLPRVTSTLRSRTYQARLYRDYLAGRNPYPVAPPGASAHELGLAFDMVTSPMRALTDLGSVWEGWGGVWGGRFGDEVHFEFPGASQHATAAQPPPGSSAAKVCDFVLGLSPLGGVQIADSIADFLAPIRNPGRVDRFLKGLIHTPCSYVLDKLR